MLSAFTARPIIELRQRDKSKIETILAYGDRVLVGLNTGALRIYRLNELHARENGSGNDERPTSSAGRPSELMREVERFSTRSIDQLAIIKEANTIISLSNYYVSLHDLQTYEPIEVLSRTKNASCFAVTSNIVQDEETEIPEIISRLAVAVKRRLLLWNWHESELSNDVDEVILTESIRTVTWASATKLVCGMNGGYVIVDAISHEIEEIMSPGPGPAGQSSRFGAVSNAGMGYMGLGSYTPKPLAAKLSDGQVLLAKDINSLFINDDGKSIQKRQVPWQTAPESIGYSYPYILALQPPAKGSLEVRNPDTLSLLQTIALPGAAQIYFPPPTVSLAHAGKGFHISSDRCVWKMGATDYDLQISELVKGGLYDEAISILGLLEDALLTNKTETLREVKMQKAEVLFAKKKFRQSMDLMNEDDVHAPPERVLRLYPPLISGELSKWAKTDGKEPNAKPEDKGDGAEPASQDEAGEASMIPGVGGITRYFMGTHKRNVSDAASITSTRRDNVETEDGASEDSGHEDKPLEGKDLMKAVLELNSYLAGTRARLQRVIDPITGKLKPAAEKINSSDDPFEHFLKRTKDTTDTELEIKLCDTFRLVDTTLFRAYMYSQPSLAGPLFRIPNFCDPHVVKDKLIEHNRYTELIDFLYGKKLHKEALELLVKFGASKKPDEAAPTLHGPNRTIQYLQNLPPSEIDLVLANAGWTLKANTEYAMEIFTGDTENAETLPRDKVVEFLHEQDVALERRYLEHIINELDDSNADFHNRLVELYVSTLKSMKKSDEWNSIMDNFVKFLREPRQLYSLGKAFAAIPRDDSSFYEAQAVVLSNMGQHKQALEIYVFKMKDYKKAEEYCNRIQKLREAQPRKNDGSEIEDDPELSIYHTLLSLYMKPQPPNKPALVPALDLLSKHGARLPAASTLGLIPDDLPVGELEAYFRGRIRLANSHVNESTIVSGLRKAEFVSVASKLHLGDDSRGLGGGRSRHVTVTDERHCMVCHRRLVGGARVSGSVVAVLPDNTVVHWGCLNKPGRDQSKTPSWARSS